MNTENRCLNIGCGSDTYGTDRLDICPTSTTTIVHDVETGIPFPDNTFDEVYSKNNLEHLRNVGFHLDEIRRVLKPNGQLNLITDNAACLKYYTLGTHMGWKVGGYRKAGGLDIHFAVFTMEHLVNHISRANLTLLDIKYMDTDYFTKHFDQIVRIFQPHLSHPRIFVRAVKTS